MSYTHKVVSGVDIVDIEGPIHCPFETDESEEDVK